MTSASLFYRKQSNLHTWGRNATLLAVKYWIAPGTKMPATAHTVLVIRMAFALVFGLGLLEVRCSVVEIGRVAGRVPDISFAGAPCWLVDAPGQPRPLDAIFLQIVCALFCTCNAGLDPARNCRQKITRSINLRPEPIKHRAVIS